MHELGWDILLRSTWNIRISRNWELNYNAAIADQKLFLNFVFFLLKMGHFAKNSI